MAHSSDLASGIALLLAFSCVLVAEARLAVELPFASNECLEQPALKGLRNDILTPVNEAGATFRADLACAKDYAARLQLYLKSGLGGGSRGGDDATEPRAPRGIVYSGGGKFQISNILIGVKYLRQVLKCKLPIEVVYHGYPEMPQSLASPLFDEALAPLKLVDSTAAPYPAHHRRARLLDFAHKVFALYAVTSFDEVLLLDADSFPLVDPTLMFEDPAYKQHGNLFFPDFYQGGSKGQEVYQALGVQPPWENNPSYRQTAGGQLLFNRVKLALVLEWVWFLNSHYPFTYKSMDSDKDTYRLAFQLAGVPDAFQQSSVWSSMLLHTGSTGACTGSNCEYPYLGSVHFDSSAEPWFVHQLKLYPTVNRNMQKDAATAWPDQVSLPASDKQALKLKANRCLAGTDVDLALQLKCPVATWPEERRRNSTMVDVATGCSWAKAWAEGSNIENPLAFIPTSWVGSLESGLASLKEVFLEAKPTLDGVLQTTSWLIGDPKLVNRKRHTTVLTHMWNKDGPSFVGPG